MTGKVGNFGRTDLRDVKYFRFTKEQPLVGLWGFNTTKQISGLSVIKFDTTSECYKDMQREAGIEVIEESTEPDPKPKKNDEKEKEKEEEGIDIMVVGIYTAGGFLAILIIFICVMAVEKCRKKVKRITEIVEL